MVSEVGSVHSDSGSQNKREAAAVLASMRGPLVDLEPSGMDRNVKNDRSPFDEDLLTWETADVLHRQRGLPYQSNHGDNLPQVVASAVGNGESATNINQLTQMMGHLCQSMEAFSQVLKNGNPVTSELGGSHPMAPETVAHAADICRHQIVFRMKGSKHAGCLTLVMSGKTS